MLSPLLGVIVLAAIELPMGTSPEPVAFPYFPDQLHAFVWRNWELVPLEKMAAVVGATTGEIHSMGKAMGLSDPPPVSAEQGRRSYITVIRRNWHLLPYDQILQLLGWTAEELAFTLREDDFLYAKLGSLKPKCEPVHYIKPGTAVQKWEQAIARVVRQDFPEGLSGSYVEPPFDFVRQLSEPVPDAGPSSEKTLFHPRFCSSYFALYGDPLLDEGEGPYPDGYLARLAATGVDGVWLQAVLYKLAPFPWDPAMSEGHETRLEALRQLVERARKHGIGVYLYLNEPRSMPVAFFESHPELKGVSEGDYSALCTSVPVVRDYLKNSITQICKQVPDLAGFFTISGSENLTNCWSHYQGASCPNCSKRSPEEVIGELHQTFMEGIQAASSSAELIAWDWGWQDAWAEGLIQKLPDRTTLQSVSEWSIAINRGGVANSVGEYSLSVIGPGPRAARNWDLAKARGLKTIAKIQAGTTWELGSVPYLPVLYNIAHHVANLRKAGVGGIMLGWTLGGFPSPNLEVVAELGKEASLSADEAVKRVAAKRFGDNLGPQVARLWKRFSDAFQEFPFQGQVVYNAPVHMGPANPLWEKPTGYSASMVGFPYDDLTSWRGSYPEDVFIKQIEKVVDGFDVAIHDAKAAITFISLNEAQRAAIMDEMDVAETCMMHYRSTANQARFVLARRALESASTEALARPHLTAIENILQSEIKLAKRLYVIQSRDSRIGFEATNHYFYVRQDLAEKVLNCRDLLDRWLPQQKARFDR